MYTLKNSPYPFKIFPFLKNKIRPEFNRHKPKASVGPDRKFFAIRADQDGAFFICSVKLRTQSAIGLQRLRSGMSVCVVGADRNDRNFRTDPA